jgi:hypothetical protein
VEVGECAGIAGESAEKIDVDDGQFASGQRALEKIDNVLRISAEEVDDFAMTGQRGVKVLWISNCRDDGCAGKQMTQRLKL